MNDFPNHDPQTGKWLGSERKSHWQKGCNDGYIGKKLSLKQLENGRRNGYNNGYDFGEAKRKREEAEKQKTAQPSTRKGY